MAIRMNWLRILAIVVVALILLMLECDPPLPLPDSWEMR